ncbi:MAG TPA: DNA polymerase III subunit gamma/tau [Candidatus Paceibacterota bacterium]|nr:DNA polymerase III subunit gamma/tau [Candidatus Paceibacterota bacterium]
MHDQVFYRKYRPQDWESVVGQEHIVRVLSRSVDDHTFSHAYLFTGSRGTGKTSVARIFARALGTNAEDIIEIDAASNRSIDDVRELRQAVRVLPFSSPYKVYIIDEVHMLSKDAWGALLKTLEEPPAHVLFILATTELDKVPETILSRCQVFTFRKPTEKILTDVVASIAKKEKFTVDAESAALIALLAGGSFRDALGLAQKVCSAAGGRTITRELVEEVTGAPSLTIIQSLYNALIARDIESVYATLAKADANHTDMMLLAELLLQTMRESLMYRYAPAMRETFDAAHAEHTVELIRRGAIEGGEAINSRSIIAMITAIERIAYAVVPTLAIELAFLEMLGVEKNQKEAK